MSEVTQTEQPKDLAEVIQFAEKKFLEINPPNLQFAKEANFLLQILRNDKNLMAVAEETPRSAVSVLTQAAALGLSLNPAKKESYVISRNIKIQDDPKVYEARLFFEPSYMGLNKIAVDSDGIEWVQARVVRQGGNNPDVFTDNGVGIRPTHTYDAFATTEERGDIVGAYCVAKTISADGADYLTTIMTKEKLDSIKSRSEAGKKGYGPWITDEEEMSMKAVMRNGFKTWPVKSPQMEEAVHISNENEGFEELNTTTPEVTRFTADQKHYYDQLIENGDDIGMFLFTASLGHGVQTSLYNSFPSRPKAGPGKGEYQRIVREMEESGRAQIEDCIASLTESASNDDELGAGQLIEELEPEAISYICDQVEPAVSAFIQNCMKEAA
jgi:recombinational DNA repair protein RecT